MYLNMIIYDIPLHVCLGRMGSMIFKFSAVIPTTQLDAFRTWKNTRDQQWDNMTVQEAM